MNECQSTKSLFTLSRHQVAVQVCQGGLQEHELNGRVANLK